MTTNSEKVRSPVWRESSSLIVCAKSPEKSNGYDYRILMVKRSDHTALFKNQAVFPGGIYDPFDESIEWLKYFEEFGVTQQSLRELVVIASETERPKILAPQGNGCYDRFFKNSTIWAREISLRLNALRETFEEVGVFLCRTRNQLNFISSEGLFYKFEFDISKWQKLVQDDAREFLNMCKELKVVPDLWGLHEWCGWASPSIFKRGYVTAFFITFLSEVPKIICEESEVKEFLWLPPSMFLLMMRESKLFFLPPQLHELSRLIPLKNYYYLKQFSWQRRKKGIIMYRPIGYVCTDGIVFVLPGDDFFSGDPCEVTVARNMDCTKSEFRARTKCLNRIENPGTPNTLLHSNIKPFNGHLMPVSDAVDKLHKL